MILTDYLSNKKHPHYCTYSLYRWIVGYRSVFTNKTCDTNTAQTYKRQPVIYKGLRKGKSEPRWENLLPKFAFRKMYFPGDSKCPFHPLVRGHLTPWNGHLTIPKRSHWITRLLKLSQKKIHLQQAVDGKACFYLEKITLLQQSLIRKINIESENDGLEDDFPLHMGDVLVPC